MFLLMVVGILIFVCGYLIFITNENADPTPAGLNNRTAIAATVGVSFCLVGFSGLISRLIRSEKLKNHFFCAFVALICSSGVFITNTILDFWIQSYSEQEKILSDIHGHFRTLPSNSTLILDGICPYVGPGVVFESNFDLAGALRLIYHDFSLHADVVKPSIRISEDAIQTTLYGATSTYQYKNLYIYHFGRKISRQIYSSNDARQYFESFDPQYGIECPDSREGIGVPIF
jgi:hypothetical protein